MGNRRNGFIPASYESSKGKGDASASIYISMFNSKNWQQLTSRQQLLYVYMKAQRYGQKTVQGSIAHGTPPPEAFYFNQSMWKETYKLYTNKNSFYKDRDVLIDKGFIEIFEDGSRTRTKNIYVYSDKWQLNDSS